MSALPDRMEIVFETEIRGQVLVSSYNSLGEGRYYDAESQTSFSFDHTTQVRLRSQAHAHGGISADEQSESIERAISRSRIPAHGTHVRPSRASSTTPANPGSLQQIHPQIAIRPCPRALSRINILRIPHLLRLHPRHPPRRKQILPLKLLVPSAPSPFPPPPPTPQTLCLTLPPQERSLAQHLPLPPLHVVANGHDQSRRALLRRRQRAPDDLQTRSRRVRLECVGGVAADSGGGEEVPG